MARVGAGLRSAGRVVADAVILTRRLWSERGRRAEPSTPAALSSRLREFVAQLPEERGSLVVFVSAIAAELPAGSRVLDAGAGDAPYRELFAHCDYVTADWVQSPHAGAAGADIVGSLDALPVAAESFDAVLSTQVLEHLPEPLQVLRELHRIIRPGGRLYLTAPLVGELHEEPHDYFRYTSHGLHHLLVRAGFTVQSVTPRTGYFTTLASLARTGTWATRVPGGRPEAEVAAIQRLLLLLTAVLPRFDSLDERRLLPLGYACVAVRPEK